jgi:hypothetical protein
LDYGDTFRGVCSGFPCHADKAEEVAKEENKNDKRVD